MKFLPPDKSYKMLGVHINPVLNFTEHFQHVTGEVRKLAAVLRRRRLSPARKQQVIDQLLQAKYHAVHLGIFTDAQMDQIDKILASASRNAHQLTPGFPTEALRRGPTQYGLGCLPIRTRAAKMGLSHLVETINFFPSGAYSVRSRGKPVRAAAAASLEALRRYRQTLPLEFLIL